MPTPLDSGSVGAILHTEVSPLGETVTTIVGQLDSACHPKLRAHLDGLLRPAEVLDLRFVAVTDAEESAAAIREATGRGVEHIVASTPVAELLERIGLDRLIVQEPSTLFGHLHTAPFGVAIHDQDLRFAYVNQTMADINGLPASMHIGYRAEHVLSVTDSGVTESLQRVLNEKEPQRRVVHARVAGRSDGFDCYFGPFTLRDRTAVIATVAPMRLEHVNEPIELLIEPTDRPKPIDVDEQDFAVLTTREREVLAAVVDGCTNLEIGSRLYLSVDTVKSHLRHVYQKLGVDNRTQAAMLAQRHDLVGE